MWWAYTSTTKKKRSYLLFSICKTRRNGSKVAFNLNYEMGFNRFDGQNAKINNWMHIRGTCHENESYRLSPDIAY